MSDQGNIYFKRIDMGETIAYVFCVWAGGVIACCRPSALDGEKASMIMSHKIYSGRNGERYISLSHKGKKRAKLKLSDINREKWRSRSFERIWIESGIPEYTLARIRKKIDALAKDHPNHTMLVSCSNRNKGIQ